MIESSCWSLSGRELYRPSLKQKSIIDYIITDPQLMAVSGNVYVDNDAQTTF